MVVQGAFCVVGSASEVAQSATKRAAAGVWGAAPGILLEFNHETTQRSHLALAGRKFNHIFTDSYDKFSRLTLKKWENKN